MTRARLMAIVALALLAIGAGAAAYDVVDDFPRALIVVAALALGLWIGWAGVLRTGAARVALLVAAVALLAVCVVAISNEGIVLGDLAVVVCLLGAAAAARLAFAVHTPLPRAPAPTRPVLFVNPHSGGGKAERFGLVDAATGRGYETVELGPGDDLRELVDRAVARGADGLAMAGGDGSQAIVAAVAAEHGLPYACIPSGTRNHFALDLGVDRNDVVGALDAFVDGGEHVVDLAEVNGRVFVNNVSLGVYAEAVQREGYRDAKLRTLLDTVPETIGADHATLDLRWRGPGGHAHAGGAAVLVSNNRYRLGRAVGNATRPRIDDGLLGITVLSAPRGRGERRRRLQRPWREWSARSFEVESSAPVPSGIDGEAVVLAPPLRFRILPGVLRARISASHPGASPSARIPDGGPASLRELGAIAAGRPRASRPAEA